MNYERRTLNSEPSPASPSWRGFLGRMRDGLVHAFSLQGQSHASRPEDLALIDRFAALLADRGLATPAVFLVQSLAPLGFIGSQLVHALSPILEMVAPPDEIDRLARLLEGRETPALFADRLIREEEARRQ